MLTPEMFGAVGDGVTDDYPALAAMFLSVGTADGGIKHTPSVFSFSAGSTYYCSQVPTIKQANCKVYGNFACIKGAAGGLAVKGGTAHALAPYISDLMIQGGSGDGLYLYNAPQAVLERVLVKSLTDSGSSCSGTGIHVAASVAVKIQDCEIDHPGAFGINVETALATNGVPAESQDTWISGCRVYFSGQSGIRVSEGGGHYISDNNIEGCNRGISVDASFSFYAEGNYLESNGTDFYTDNAAAYISGRYIQCGLIRANDSNSRPNSIIIQAGNGIVIRHNRLCGAVYIEPAATNTVYDRELMLVGTYSNGSSSTVVKT